MVKNEVLSNIERSFKMNDLRVNNRIIINDIKNHNSGGMSINKEMIKFIGKEAKITQIFKNMYDKNDYYFLDIDQGNNIWQRQMLELIK